MSITGLASYTGEKQRRFNTLDEWLSWQENLHFTEIELGLDRCSKVADVMLLLPSDYFVVSIAGTNGKGSSARLLEQILLDAGYRVGLYTSPHLLRYNERIRINGLDAEDDALCDAFEAIDHARSDISLTYFEFGTLAAMSLFRDHGIDIAIMEVGMGGRLDAVNMLDADIALLTTVDMDHERWLGTDRNAIGREKSGIFRSMRPAICMDPDPPPSVIESAGLVGAKLMLAGHDFGYEVEDGNWSWHSGLDSFEQLPLPAGQPVQARNAAGILTVLQAMRDNFPVEEECITRCLSSFRMPGRLQVIPGKIELVLDVSHNPQSAAILATHIQGLSGRGRVHLLLGMLVDKNHGDYIRKLAGTVDNWYLCSLETNRGTTGAELADTLLAVDRHANHGIYGNPAIALEKALSVAEPGDTVVICGSFVTVGLAMRHIEMVKGGQAWNSD